MKISTKNFQLNHFPPCASRHVYFIQFWSKTQK